MLQFLSRALASPRFSQVPQTVFEGEPYPGAKIQPRNSSLIIILSLAAACFFSLISGVWTARVWLNDPPILESVNTNFKATKFNGSLFGESIFRQEGSPEVDSAWESLGVDYRPSIVSEAYAELSGIKPSYVRVSPEYGGGFVANVEGIHHLHCLSISVCLVRSGGTKNTHKHFRISILSTYAETLKQSEAGLQIIKLRLTFPGTILKFQGLKTFLRAYHSTCLFVCLILYFGSFVAPATLYPLTNLILTSPATGPESNWPEVVRKSTRRDRYQPCIWQIGKSRLLIPGLSS
ncbi:hypothetical protein J7T55_002949 [Diaporthe amygdali]|uniref:uncharacterized protein n=1 Tax=Phomopsis amygdali TaxID=1214568 RepID=UPI0022FF416A|nr:uncharacterized protein J7T55_002949 [Diaporthe amygdali]KAJ0122436.1 hypothetical protein J7T55_002949 [Diaporthe amygdali]